MKKLLFLLAPIILSAQYTGRVGINTTDPKATMHIKGDAIIEKIPTGLLTDSIIVTNNGHIRKIAISALSGGNSVVCPRLDKVKSSPWSLHFDSDSSVPNPNSPLVIETLNFVQSGPFIKDNKYFYSWSNTSGKPLNLSNFTVYFGQTKCVYSNN